jgi:hypothetical protein
MQKRHYISHKLLTTAGRSLQTTTLLFLLFLPFPLLSQPLQDCPDCPCILTQAQQKVSEKDFESAIRLFNAYKACDPSQGVAADEGILEVFELIRSSGMRRLQRKKKRSIKRKK